MIVFPDADLERAVDGAIRGMNFGVSTGPSCGSNSRTYVHRELHDEFVRRTAERLEAMRVGTAYAHGVDMGPVVSAAHHERVMGFVRSGREQGARLVAGGDRPTDGGAPESGYFVRPTLFTGVTADMRIAREEIFGPVMSMAAWDDEDEVVASANDTTFGLTASVWTRDLDTAHRVADRLRAGYVWVNDSATHYWGTPFGGQKNSGTGREESIEEYESFLELKAVHVRLRR
jgi:2-formylbenzoate dehydrogenase